MYDIHPIAKHLHIHFTIHIEFDEYEEQYGECQQRRASVREKRQRDTDNGHYAEHHTDIYDKMKSEYPYHTITIHSREYARLPFAQIDNTVYKGKKQKYYHYAARKAPLFGYGTKHEVGILFGYKFKFSLSPFQKSFTKHTSRRYGYFRLVGVPFCSLRVFFEPEQSR